MHLRRASSIQLRLWLIYLFSGKDHNFLFTTSCFISWPFTEIWWKRRNKKVNTQQSSLSVLVCFGLCFVYWNTCVIYSDCFSFVARRAPSLSRNQFLGSVLTYVFLTFSLNYNDGVFSSRVQDWVWFLFSRFRSAPWRRIYWTFLRYVDWKSVHIAVQSGVRNLPSDPVRAGENEQSGVDLTSRGKGSEVRDARDRNINKISSPNRAFRSRILIILEA